MDTIFSADNISLTFRHNRGFRGKKKPQTIFEGLDLEIKKGESLAVVGRNGAGKSTLLRVIAGILKVDKGEVKNYARAPSLLSLQAGFMPILSGRENIFLSASLLGLSQKEIQNRLDEIITYADLEDHVDKAVSTYSSGMKARLGFAVAMHANADLILIDEVLGVGDEEFRKKSSATIRDMIESEKTVVFVSHNKASVESLCDRAVWLENGRIVDSGDPAQVTENYYHYTQLCNNLAETFGVTPSKVRENKRHEDPLEEIMKVRVALMEEGRQHA